MQRATHCVRIGARLLRPGFRLEARTLASSGQGGPPSRAWDRRPAWEPSQAVHGKPEERVVATGVPEGKPDGAGGGGGGGAPRGAAGRSGGSSRGGGSWSGGGNHGAFAPLGRPSIGPEEKANLVKFSAYVRQRLKEMNQRLPPTRSRREDAELHFLEEQVVQDHMPRSKRQLRDPLVGVPAAHITHTNLNLLSRFVSEAGNILPRRLTGTKQKKQKKLAKAIKRAQVLALMPKTWKLPRFRHVQYTDQFSRPERNLPMRPDDDDFRDPPDIRYPGQFEKKRHAAQYSLAEFARDRGAPPSGAGRSAARGGAPKAGGGEEARPRPAGGDEARPASDSGAGT